MPSKKIPVVCFFAMTSGDWGGAGRVLFTNLGGMDRAKITPLILLTKDGPIIQELKQRGLSHSVWGRLTEPGNVMEYFRAFLRALRFFRREHVRLVHINSSNFWRPAELLAAWVLRIPIIAHYHVINSRPAPGMKLCHAAICVSRYTAEQSLPRELNKPVIYNPVDLGRFDGGKSLRDQLGLLSTDIVVSFLGQIREIKGVGDFIAMARRIDNLSARFLIAGECRDPKKFAGSYTEADLQELARGDPRIRYIGYVKAVEDVYHTSDIIVVPSRWQEPLGLINLEAGACSRPVVATRVGGIPEVVMDGITGFLVEPGDVVALASRVNALLDSTELRIRMGAAAREHVEAAFGTKPVKEFEQLLRSYVG